MSSAILFVKRWDGGHGIIFLFLGFVLSFPLTYYLGYKSIMVVSIISILYFACVGFAVAYENRTNSNDHN